MAKEITFEDSIGHILLSEGGYVNDPNDAGGETNFGISKRAYPNIDIKALTREKAIEIYKRDYWEKLPKSVPNELMFTVFDMAVNAGMTRAMQLMKGVTTLEGYTKARCDFYRNLVDRKPQNRKFLRGWINRSLKAEQVTKNLLDLSKA